MAKRIHHYRTRLVWTGSKDSAAPFHRHDRAYEIQAGDKPPIPGSSDAVFRGDATRWNPEDLLVASLSACHKLWYLGLCAAAGITVLSYTDEAEGTMEEERADEAGQFVEVVLHPVVLLAAGANAARALDLHNVAHENCFIARSVNFPVRHEAVVTAAPS